MPRFERSQFKKTSAIPPPPRGLVLWYYGDGKGKTTAAIGLAVRAKGAGLRVGVFQFMKSENWQSYERNVLRDLDVPVQLLGGGFVGIIDDAHPIAWHRQKSADAPALTQVALVSKQHDVVIADKLGMAIDADLVTVEQAVVFIKTKPRFIGNYRPYQSLSHRSSQ